MQQCVRKYHDSPSQRKGYPKSAVASRRGWRQPYGLRRRCRASQPVVITKRRLAATRNEIMHPATP